MTYQEQPQSRVPQVTGGVGDNGREWVGDSIDPSGDLACPHLPRVSLYHDGELNDAERRELAEHLTRCRPCSEALAFFGRVSGVFSATAPEHLEMQSRQRLRLLVAEAEGTSVPRMPAHVRWVRRLTAVAAALFLVAVCRLAYQHYPFTTPNVTPISHPKPAPLLPENTPKATGNPDRLGPNDRSGSGNRRPAGDGSKAAPATPRAPDGPPSTSPAGPTIG
jgi:hypothetical protein